VRRGDDEFELPHFVWRHIDGAVGEDVGFNPLEQSEAAAVLAVQHVDFGVLLHRALHAHATGDAETVGMIRDPRARPSALETGIHDRLERFGAITPDRMHLEITTVSRSRWRTLARQNLLNRGSAQIESPQPVQPRDLLLFARFAHGAFDKRAAAVDDQFARDAIGRRTNPRMALNVFAVTSGVMSRSIRSTAFAARL
jgi:hypothetical protein